MEHEAAEAGLDVGVESEVAEMVTPEHSNRWSGSAIISIATVMRMAGALHCRCEERPGFGA